MDHTPLHRAAARSHPPPSPAGDPPPWAEALLARVEHQEHLLVQLLDALRAKRKPHLTVAEAADAVGRSAYTVRRWIAEGRITAIRVEGDGPRGRLLIAREQLDRLISRGMGGDIAPTDLGEPA
ncbi:helix-turn-helix domain-containing protein [Gemmata sp.]|uniref:helix-turn-helix domain-containing protein n=1 Tax=Gemmata sp. TaxID=1914242 RepID=UPI003F726CB9